MSFIQERLRKRATRLNRTLVFPEGHVVKVLTAVEKITELGIADVIIIGDVNKIRKLTAHENISLKKIKILSPENTDLFDKLAARFLVINNERSLGVNDPEAFLKDPLNFGALIVEQGFAHGMVCGAVTSSGKVIKTAINLNGISESSGLVSSSFLMINVDNDKYYTFADCGVIPVPTFEQLVKIAYDSAQTHEKLTGQKPKIAFLSFSTKGSAKHESINKVRNAAELFFDTYPQYESDGELQIDAAVDSAVAKIKAPDSKLKGDANVLIFPDLNAGNIGYKIAHRFGRFQAWGPILQGLKKPMMDLSRGCSIDDIVNVAAICAVLT